MDTVLIHDSKQLRGESWEQLISKKREKKPTNEMFFHRKRKEGEK